MRKNLGIENGQRYSFEHKKTGLILIGVVTNVENGMVTLNVTDSPFFDPNKHDHIQFVKSTLLSFVDTGLSTDQLELKKLKEELARKDMVIEGLRSEKTDLDERVKSAVKNYDNSLKALGDSRRENTALEKGFDKYKEEAFSIIGELEIKVERLTEENELLKNKKENEGNTNLELELMRRIIAMHERG